MVNNSKKKMTSIDSLILPINVYKIDEILDMLFKENSIDGIDYILKNYRGLFRIDRDVYSLSLEMVQCMDRNNYLAMSMTMGTNFINHNRLDLLVYYSHYLKRYGQIAFRHYCILNDANERLIDYLIKNKELYQSMFMARVPVKIYKQINKIFKCGSIQCDNLRDCPRYMTKKNVVLSERMKKTRGYEKLSGIFEFISIEIRNTDNPKDIPVSKNTFYFTYEKYIKNNILDYLMNSGANIINLVLLAEDIRSLGLRRVRRYRKRRIPLDEFNMNYVGIHPQSVNNYLILYPKNLDDAIDLCISRENLIGLYDRFKKELWREDYVGTFMTLFKRVFRYPDEFTERLINDSKEISAFQESVDNFLSQGRMTHNYRFMKNMEQVDINQIIYNDEVMIKIVTECDVTYYDTFPLDRSIIYLYKRLVKENLWTCDIEVNRQQSFILNSLGIKTPNIEHEKDNMYEVKKNKKVFYERGFTKSRLFDVKVILAS